MNGTKATNLTNKFDNFKKMQMESGSPNSYMNKRNN